MSRGRCFVEIGADDTPFRIFRSPVDARLSPAFTQDKVREWPRVEATKAVREKIYRRSKGECERCGKPTDWNHGHLDERVSRGNGGEISVSNSWWLCADCHITGPDAEHSNRRWGGKRI